MLRLMNVGQKSRLNGKLVGVMIQEPDNPSISLRRLRIRRLSVPNLING